MPAFILSLRLADMEYMPGIWRLYCQFHAYEIIPRLYSAYDNHLRDRSLIIQPSLRVNGLMGVDHQLIGLHFRIFIITEATFEQGEHHTSKEKFRCSSDQPRLLICFTESELYFATKSSCFRAYSASFCLRLFVLTETEENPSDTVFRWGDYWIQVLFGK